MNGPDLSKITSGLDEVSIKKQFNAQQQNFPCWLKASFESSLHRNGPGYPLSDCHVFRENCLRNNPHHPLSITQMSKYIYQNQRFSISQDNLHSKTCDSLVNRKPIPSSPYSRPLSAKDFGLYMSESNPSLSSARTYPTRSHPNPIPSTMSASSSFPTNVNFFLKPQSLTLKNPNANNDVSEKYPLSKCNKSEVSCNSSKELQQITSSSFSKQSAFLSTISTSSVQILTSVNKHISSIPKPGCGFTKIPDIPLNVRNLSYSPAVSYVENRQLLANDNHPIQSENSFLEKKKIYTFGQTVYYNIAYKPEKCLPGAKPFTTSANNINSAPKEESLLTETNLRAHQKDICIQTSETNCFQAVNEAASETSSSSRKG